MWIAPLKTALDRNKNRSEHPTEELIVMYRFDIPFEHSRRLIGNVEERLKEGMKIDMIL